MSVEDIKPYPESPDSKTEQIRNAFDAIAGRYDRMNRIMSFGVDINWRRQALRWLAERQPRTILDVATGTGDFALLAAEMLPDARITGLDLSTEMLSVAEGKVRGRGLENRIKLMAGDILHPPAFQEKFDAATIAFGVRNFESLQQGLKATQGLLRPGGVVLVLEQARPCRFPVRQLHGLYLRRGIPLAGRLIAGLPAEYRYLQHSVAEVPQGVEMEQILTAAGFRDPQTRYYTFGSCACYLAER